MGGDGFSLLAGSPVFAESLRECASGVGAVHRAGRWSQAAR